METQKRGAAPNQDALIVRLGRALSIARRRRRMTQQELANAAGVSRLTIIRAEAGQPGVAVGTLLDILTALDTRLVEGMLQAVADDPAGEALERDRAMLPRRVRARPPQGD